MKSHALLLSQPLIPPTLRHEKNLTRRSPSCTNSLVDGRRISGKAWRALELDFTSYVVYDGFFGIWSNTLAAFVKVEPVHKEGDSVHFRESWKMVGWNYEDGQVLIEFAEGIKQWFDFPEDKIDETVEWLLKQIDSLVEKGYLKPDEKDNEDDQRLVPTEKIMPWRPSIHLPKWCTRLWATIPSPVICEHLHDITEEQAKREGCTAAFENTDPGTPWTALTAFECLWDKLHGPDSWPANGPVYVIPFELIPEPEMKDNTMGE